MGDPTIERLSRDRDIIIEAINEYDSFMLDDDFDAQVVLDRIIERMRSRASLSHTEEIGR
jgi:hypothetical protein